MPPLCLALSQLPCETPKREKEPSDSTGAGKRQNGAGRVVPPLAPPKREKRKEPGKGAGRVMHAQPRRLVTACVDHVVCGG
jgi:hypothetical protein